MIKVNIKKVVVISKNVPLVNLLGTLDYTNYVKEIHKIENVTVTTKVDFVYLANLQKQV